MIKCPDCGAEFEQEQEVCPDCEKSSPDKEPEPANEAHKTQPDSEEESFSFMDALRDDLEEDFISPESTGGKKTGLRKNIGTKVARAAYRVLMPPSQFVGFRIGFWVMRVAGLSVFLSWLFFGLFQGQWSAVKFTVGLMIILIGPFSLWCQEFTLIFFLLKGSSREAWTDFWSFKRMMTPRSIQSVFFLIFWLIFASGALTVASGIYDLAKSPQFAKESLASVFSAKSIAEKVSKAISDARSSRDYQLLQQLTASNPQLLKAVKEVGGNDNETTTTVETSEDQKQGSFESAMALLNLKSDEEEEKESEELPYFGLIIFKIISGLIYMIIGPLTLRFTCEWIILAFRINETLTDISKQLEIANELRKEDGSRG